jgi:hypothetical protein
MHQSSLTSQLPIYPAGFDFTGNVRRLCADMICRLPELGHIDLDRVAITFRQARKSARHGIQATLTPLRFEGGHSHTTRGGRKWTVQRLYDEQGREMLYVLSIYLHRFMDHPLREKLVTVLHELWHISPNFDGDLRRHPGRCYAHSHSQNQYDAEMGRLVDRWLAQGPDEQLYAFLRCSFRELHQRHGSICGVRIPALKLIPVV